MPDSLHACIACAAVATGLASSPTAWANPHASTEGWPAGVQASAFYQCHFGARGQNNGSVMVWTDEHHRVVALASPRADDPVPAWTQGAGRAATAKDFNALFRTVRFEQGERVLVPDRSGRGMTMRLRDRMGPCVRSVEE